MASIRKRGKNSYQITVSQGYDSSGKKLSKPITVKRPKGFTDKQWEKELEKISAEFERKVERGTYLDGGKMTFAELCNMWIEKYAEKELEPKTLARYKELLQLRILPAMGHIKLEKLQPTHLLDFYADLKEPGMRLDTRYVALPTFKDTYISIHLTQKKLVTASGVSECVISRALKGETMTSKTAEALSKALDKECKKSTESKISYYFVPAGEPGTLSANTILHHHRLISAILQDAVEWQLIMSNPAERVKSPKSEKSKPTHYNIAQTKALINALAAEPIKYRTMIILDAFTGLRTGEFMGLDWTDLDLENGTLSVNKVSQYLSGKGTFTKNSPKNEHSIRTVNIPPFVVSLMKQYKSWWNEQKLACGDLWQDSNRLFVTWDGRPLFTYTLTNWLPEFLHRHNLPKITPHGIRHTFASLLAKKIPVPELSRLLGHAQISTTDIYVHNLLRETNAAAGDMLENMLIEQNTTQIKQG